MIKSDFDLADIVTYTDTYLPVNDLDILYASLNVPYKAKGYRSAEYTFSFRTKSAIPAGGSVELDFPS